MQRIFAKLYGFKYSYLKQMIYKQQYGFKYFDQLQIIFNWSISFIDETLTNTTAVDRIIP